jgi:hypothetical protein
MLKKMNIDNIEERFEDYLSPYIQLIKIINELIDLPIDVKNNENITEISNKLNKIENLLHSFNIMGWDSLEPLYNYDSPAFYINKETADKVYNIFCDYIKIIEENKGKYFDETYSSIKHCYHFIPSIVSIFHNYYSFFLKEEDLKPDMNYFVYFQ